MSHPCVDNVESLIRAWRAVDAERLTLALYSRARALPKMFGLRAFDEGVELAGGREACFPSQWAAESWAIQRFPDFCSRARRATDASGVVVVWQLDPDWIEWHRERRKRREHRERIARLTALASKL